MKVVNSLSILTFIYEDFPYLEMRLRIAGLFLQCFSELGECLAQKPLSFICQAELKVGFGIVRSNPQGIIENLFGFLILLLTQKDNAVVIASLWIRVRGQDGNLVVLLLRLRCHPQLPV